MAADGDNIFCTLRGTTGRPTDPFSLSWTWRVVEGGSNLQTWMARLGGRFIQDPIIGNYPGLGFFWPRRIENWTVSCENLNNTAETAVWNFGVQLRDTTNAVMPPEACAFVQVFTALAGRSFRGRIYWPIATTRGSDAGRISADYIGRLGAMFNGWRAPQYQGSAAALGVWSRKLSTPGNPRVTLATGVSIANRVRWNRRRR